MPNPKPRPLNKSERALIAEAVEGFWTITVETYRVNMGPFHSLSAAKMSAWHTHFVTEMTAILTSFLDRLCPEEHAWN